MIRFRNNNTIEKKKFLSSLRYQPLRRSNVRSFLKFKGDIKNFFINHPKGAYTYWLFWLYGMSDEYKTQELIDICALSDPCGGLQNAAHLLSPKILEECVLYAPWLALNERYIELSDDLLNKCALMVPSRALIHHSQRLNEDVLRQCALDEPLIALKYAYDSLSEEMIKKCIDLIYNKLF